MANGEFLEVLSPSALKDLQTLNAEIVKTIAGVKEVNANMISIKTPSGSDSAIKKLTADYDAQAQTIRKLQVELNALANARTLSNNSAQKTITAGKQLQKNTVEQAEANRLLRLEQTQLFRANTLLGGAYAKASAQLVILKRNIKDATITHGEQSEQVKRLSAEYETLNGRVRKADEIAGDFQRNVGNYSGGIQKGFNAIWSSVRQLAYIIPGLGIAGIFDIILSQASKLFGASDAVKKFNESLIDVEATQTEQAATLKTVSQVLNDTNTTQQQYNNALKVAQQEGISINAIEEARSGNLALINKELEDQIDISIKKAKADKLVNLIVENEIEQTKNLKKAKEDYNSWYRRALRATLGSTQTGAQIEAGLVNEEIKGINELERENKELYAELKKLGLENLLDVKKASKAKKEKIALDFSEIESQYKLREAILQRQKAEASDLMNDENSNLERRIKAREEFSRISIELIDLQYQKESALIADKAADDLAKNELALKNKELSQKQYADNVTAITNRLNNELLALENNHDQNINELRQQDLAYYKKIEDEKRQYSQKTEDLIIASAKDKFKQVSENERNTLKTRQQAFEEYLKLAKKELDLAKIRELANAKSQQEIDFITQKYAALYRQLDEIKSPIKKAQEATADWVKSFADSFAGSTGFTSLFKILRGEVYGFGKDFEATFQGITEVAQEAFRFLSELSTKHFENEYENLAQQRDIALLFAGESATAREEIERQYEARQRAIKRREFQAKKQQALFNIAIDTAQAIVGFLANPGGPEGVALSVAAGVIGALQAGIVLSQQAPQFWKGTDSAPEGFAWTQEKGREIITDKYGKIKSTGSDKGAQLTWLNKGDKVLNNDKTMDYLMFNDSLNNILTGNDIGSPVFQVSNAGISDSQVNKIVSAIENKAEFSQLISNGDLKTVYRKGNTETEIMNRRVNFKGTRV